MREQAPDLRLTVGDGFRLGFGMFLFNALMVLLVIGAIVVAGLLLGIPLSSPGH